VQCPDRCLVNSLAAFPSPPNNASQLKRGLRVDSSSNRDAPLSRISYQNTPSEGDRTSSPMRGFLLHSSQTSTAAHHARPMCGRCMLAACLKAAAQPCRSLKTADAASFGTSTYESSACCGRTRSLAAQKDIQARISTGPLIMPCPLPGSDCSCTSQPA
jgi:hypothetical protein